MASQRDGRRIFVGPPAERITQLYEPTKGNQTMTTIHLHTEELNTVQAALEFYRDSGMGEPARRPDWLHEIACPEPGDTTTLDAAGIHELSVLISDSEALRTGSKTKSAALSDMTAEALKRGKPFFVVVQRIAHYYDSIQDAHNCACDMNGIVYTATAKGYRKTIVP